MEASLDEEYFTWLCSQVEPSQRKSSRTHWGLLDQLHKTEFIWLVANDDNRMEDGRDLRHEFLETCDIDEADPLWMGLGCSMLEMLIGLARRLWFEADGEPRVWFWHLIEIMDLLQYNDRHYDKAARKAIDEALERVIYRNYDPDGHGGLFPLNHATQDQTKVELWYQLSCYLVEVL